MSSLGVQPFVLAVHLGDLVGELHRIDLSLHLQIPALPPLIAGAAVSAKSVAVAALDFLHTRPVLWLFALGRAFARAKTVPQRAALSALTILTVPGYFGEPWREATIIAGILVLAWLRTIPLPAVLHRPLGVLASASFFAYVTQWGVFPDIREVDKALAVVASLAVGIAYWAFSIRVMSAVDRWKSRLAGYLRRRHLRRRRAAALM